MVYKVLQRNRIRKMYNHMSIHVYLSLHIYLSIDKLYEIGLCDYGGWQSKNLQVDQQAED